LNLAPDHTDQPPQQGGGDYQYENRYNRYGRKGDDCDVSNVSNFQTQLP
jgi:hypothetical protein